MAGLAKRIGPAWVPARSLLHTALAANLLVGVHVTDR